MTVVKICGITNLADAKVAVDAGADALGFNFYPRSPRYILPADAYKIVLNLPRNVMSVGIFVNESVANVLQIATEAGITALQLHGDELPEYCEAVSKYFVIKAFSASQFDRESVARYKVPAVMLDAGDEQIRGGTGRIADWSLAARIRVAIDNKLFLAGGLSPLNVAEAIHAVRPYAVDACSSLEMQPGRKNHDQVRAFIKEIRAVKP